MVQEDSPSALVEKELEGAGLIVKIDGEGAVSAFRFGPLCHISSSMRVALGMDETW